MNNLDPYTFYFELPLYTPIPINDENYDDLVELLGFNEKITAYNPTLKENTSFSVSSRYIDYVLTNGGTHSCDLHCVRTGEILRVYCHLDKDKTIFQKIGQYPSIADFHISRIKQYDKVLNKEKLREFTRAIGLAANGVGIGSFVYLRRIFEDLIEEAHSIAKEKEKWNEEEYKKSRMGEKITILQDHLPAFLVENSSLYGILSVGIHSLKEEDCLAYFETVKVGIELILDEKLERFEKNKKIEVARQKIDTLNNKLSKK